jgi:hypothetical protein
MMAPVITTPPSCFFDDSGSDPVVPSICPPPLNGHTGRP